MGRYTRFGDVGKLIEKKTEKQISRELLKIGKFFFEFSNFFKKKFFFLGFTKHFRTFLNFEIIFEGFYTVLREQVGKNVTKKINFKN